VNHGVAERLASLRREIDEELLRLGRDPSRVTLVGVSKRQPPGRVAAAITAGLTDIGESYLQEARRKFPPLPAVRKHFIGHVQTNKAAAIATAFDVVQSVDRAEAGIALSKGVREVRKALPILLQLNVSPSDRFGCPPTKAERLAEMLRGLPGLRLDGVMAMGPLAEDLDAISRAFELAAKTWERVGGSTLSIGMAIFGPREDGRHT
jgi:hypothetical protein